MKKIFSIVILILIMCTSVFILSGCQQANTAQHNITVEADKFNVYRRVTVINLRTDRIILECEGLISIKDSTATELAIIIKTGNNQFKMHYVYTGSEIVYVVEQLESTSTNPYYWKLNIYVPRADFELDA